MSAEATIGSRFWQRGGNTLHVQDPSKPPLATGCVRHSAVHFYAMAGSPPFRKRGKWRGSPTWSWPGLFPAIPIIGYCAAPTLPSPLAGEGRVGAGTSPAMTPRVCPYRSWRSYDAFTPVCISSTRSAVKMAEAPAYVRGSMLEIFFTRLSRKYTVFV